MVGASGADPSSGSPEMINSKQAELSKLQETRQYLTLWDKILAPRSQAWSAMDFFLALLPEGHDVICEHLKYAIKQAASKPGPVTESSSAGFSREWSIEGSCSEQGRVHLERLREGSTISTIFASTAIRLDDPSFGLSDTRIVQSRTARRGKSTIRPPKASLEYWRTSFVSWLLKAFQWRLVSDSRLTEA